jgi:seryl-tRNA synthetase
MRPRDALLRALRTCGELWEAAPGLVGLRGDALATLRVVERRIAALCATETADEWCVPAALSLSTLERSGYFASFPQWLTLASHLTDDEAVLERVASSASPASAAAECTEPAGAALPPAVCYHVYAALAGTTVAGPRIVTAQGCCWRHEGARVEPLARGWAFTMREIVCIGSEEDCASFRDRGVRLAHRLADELGVDGVLAEAEDPFFAPTARGRALLQRLRALKHELRLFVGDGETVAAASFNLHERHFGEAFDIRLPDGEPAHTACVAFGLERWLLATLLRASRTAAAAAHHDDQEGMG